MKDLKVLITAIVISALAFILLIFTVAKSSTKNAYQLYEQGQSFYLKGDFQNAYYNFSKISVFCELYELSLLKQAVCALNAGDKKTAYKKFKLLTTISNNPHIAPIAIYNAALINMEHKKYSYAHKKFKKLYKKYPESDYKKAAAYQLGILFKDKNPQLAKKYFIEYLQYAPYGRYSTSAMKKIKDLKIYLDDDEKCVLANSYYKNEKYSETINLSKDLNSSQAAFVCAKALEKKGDKKSALVYYLKSLRLCDEKMSEEDIALVVSKCIRLSDLPPKTACENLLKVSKKSAAYPAILFEYASYLSKMNSIKCYETIYKKYPNSYQAAQSLWNVFLYTYKNGYSAKAKLLADEYLKKYSNKISTPAMKFWHAKILLQEGKTLQANKELKELIKTEPDTYYAYVAHNLIKGVNTPFNTMISNNLEDFKGFTKKDLKQIFNNDKTLVMVAKLNDIQTLKLFKLHDNFMLSYIAAYEGNMPYSLYLARKAFGELNIKPQHNDSRYKLLYPIKFVDTINKYSARYSQNPYLILALIREESSFNITAISPVGAAGLMQLMPSTASSLGFGPVDYNILFNEDKNINLGVKYFSDLKNIFSGGEMLAILSYNGGPSNVNLWKEKLDVLNFDEFVEDIPYSETQNYIKRVFASYWNYVRIYCK